MNLFSLYDSKIKKIFDEAVKLKNSSIVVESRLTAIFNDYLPAVIIEKLAGNLTDTDLPL